MMQFIQRTYPICRVLKALIVIRDKKEEKRKGKEKEKKRKEKERKEKKRKEK